ncbi:MAG: thioredoxin [Micrococcales bacterium]
MATLELTEDNFSETILAPGITFVDFWAEWCGPCRMFGPIFEEASEKHPDIKFGKLDTEAQRNIAAQANITSIPTLMLFRDGILLFNQAGALPGAALEELIGKVRELDMDHVRAEIAKAEAEKVEE